MTHPLDASAQAAHAEHSRLTHVTPIPWAELGDIQQAFWRAVVRAALEPLRDPPREGIFEVADRIMTLDPDERHKAQRQARSLPSAGPSSCTNC